jgi:HlyD family secretion protein
VREGDAVTKGAPLFAVDPDLQRDEVEMAKATLTNARQVSERAQALLKTAAGTQKAVDDAQAALRTAEARLASAQTRLARRKALSPVTGAVQQIYYRPGELVPAGRPVVSLLPPGNIKVRFFVSETMLPKIALGQAVTVHCDGCKADVPARVTFISRTAEFTPPVIYSLEERAKLVFLIEARSDTPGDLRVGQPVDVRLAEAKK